MKRTVAEEILSGSTPELRIVIDPVEEGGFTAECLDIPGCVSEGETYAETEVNIRKAIDACLSVMFEDFLLRIKPSAVSTAQFATVAISLPHVTDQAA